MMPQTVTRWSPLYQLSKRTQVNSALIGPKSNRPHPPFILQCGAKDDSESTTVARHRQHRGTCGAIDSHVGDFGRNAEGDRVTFYRCQLPANPPKEAL